MPSPTLSEQPVLIALDWGTTSFRAYLVSAARSVIASIDQPKGILNIGNGDFESAFSELLRPWPRPWAPTTISLSSPTATR